MSCQFEIISINFANFGNRWITTTFQYSEPIIITIQDSVRSIVRTEVHFGSNNIRFRQAKTYLATNLTLQYRYTSTKT